MLKRSLIILSLLRKTLGVILSCCKRAFAVVYSRFRAIKYSEFCLKYFGKKKRQTLSVCMMVQNSEKTIRLALESLRSVYDDLIIVDGGSNDGTVEICHKYKARIIHSAWPLNHSDQRNVYMRHVNTDWVFVIDSDEFVSDHICRFLSLVKTRDIKGTDNFWFSRTWLAPQDKTCFNANSFPDYQRRLFKYSKDVHYDGVVHEEIHGLVDQGVYLAKKYSIYHLELYINTLQERKEKVRRREQLCKGSGYASAYLPEVTIGLRLKKLSMNDLYSTVKELLSKL